MGSMNEAVKRDVELFAKWQAEVAKTKNAVWKALQATREALEANSDAASGKAGKS